MAIRARLVAPQPQPQKSWPWHKLKSSSISVEQLLSGDRRFEAETYLSKGFDFRAQIEKISKGWSTLGSVASVFQPNRLKGILVSPEYGSPFLAATQVFDIRPAPRKFLALEQMEKAHDCFVQDSTILVTRSGSVGRSILAYAPHRNVVISDDLLRVTPKNTRDRGWIYAYLHTPQVRAMTVGAQYGHIIKHLEVSHLEALPIPSIDGASADSFNKKVSRILELRNTGFELIEEAEKLFSKAVGNIKLLAGT